jgi:hypothetical protein
LKLRSIPLHVTTLRAQRSCAWILSYVALCAD